MTGEEAAGDGERKNEAPAVPCGERGARPNPAGQHRLDAQAEEEIDGEGHPGPWLEQGEGQEVEVVAVPREDRGVEQEKAGHGSAEDNSERHDHLRPRDQQRQGEEQEERKTGERAHVTEEGDQRVDPARRRRES
jgi:hypothetical protein